MRAGAAVIGAMALLAALVAPAGAQQDQSAGAPSTPQTVTAVADRVAKAASTLTALQQRQQAVADQLAASGGEVQRLQTQLGDLQRRSSELVAAARRQALATYMRGDAAGQSFALASALGQANVNDAVWSLGVLKVTHDQTIELVHHAAVAKGDANQDLTGALARNASLAAEQKLLGPAVEVAQADLQAAQAQLTGLVQRLGSTTADGMTTIVYEAYRAAATEVGTESPACGLRWELLAAIGKTESNHGGGRLDALGDSVTPIIGIPIGADTDGGALDHDAGRDHAVGPMQFLPSTWQRWGADGDGDGDADPHNIFDATLAAGRYLCSAAGGLTLLTRDGVIRAILAYNPNEEYLRVVGARFEALASDVANGWFSSGDLPLPTANPGNGADAGGPPTDVTGPTARTEVRAFAVFGPDGVTAQTSGDVAAAVCASPSAVLAGRPGFEPCGPVAAAAAPAAEPTVLDPCVVSPSDPTLVACVADPRLPVHLVRATTPQAPQAAATAPPYVALVLSGGDLCLPLAPAGAPGPPVDPDAPATTSTTTTTTTTPQDPAVTSPPATTAAPTTTTSTTTTTPPATTAPRAPSAPAAYRCASGVMVLGQPNASAATWQATVFQPGAPERALAVAAAWT